MPLRLQSIFMPVCALVATGILCGPAAVQAQSSAYATVSGTVRGGMGEPLVQATVMLTPVRGGEGTESATSGSGVFTFRLVRPGSYELRIEALGYRPLVARTLALSGGEARTVDLTLTAEPPPVLTVDTMMLAGASAGRWRADGVRLGESALRSIPHRTGDLSSVASLSSRFDGSLGSFGLPGATTLIVADGVPFYRAPHPTALAEQLPAPLFPAATLGSVVPTGSPAEVEWPGSTGGYVGLTTLASTGPGFEVGGAYSGDAAWFSDELDFDTPSLLSYEGDVRGTVRMQDGSQLVLAADVLEHQTPVDVRLSEDAAMQLAGLDAELLSRLAEPGVESYARYGGVARFDMQSSQTSSAFIRGSGSLSRRSFEGSGPLADAGATAFADESVDVSLAGGYLSEMGSRTTIELRGGFSGSYRDFESGPLGAPPAYLAESASALGNVPFSAAESSRTDVVLTPMIRRAIGAASLRAGISARVSRHTMEQGPGEQAELVFTDAAALLADQGYARVTNLPEASFGTEEYGIFAQYEGVLGTGLRLRVGGRYDFEQIGSDRPGLNEDWLATTGLANAEYPASLHQLGFGGSLIWDPTGTDRTRITLSGSLRDGDVDTRAIAEVLSRATEATVTEATGAGVAWPAGSVPGGASELRTLSLFGPDTRAPRTSMVGVGLLQRVTPALTLSLEGTSRRTDFLLRRRDLNRPVVAVAEDPNGRPIYGTLQKEGSLVTATGEDSRRFPEFGSVWALDPDGWSEYRGVTVGMEYATDALDLFGSYTFSETTDNWVGAARSVIDGELRPGLPEASDEEPWAEGVSDFDVPHRAAAGVAVRFGSAEVSGLYRYRSGLPFTPGYRLGVDANGDGSVRNDVAFVPDTPEITGLLDVWPCLESQLGGFAVRNSCRGPDRHTVNARVRVGLGEIGGRAASLTLDALNLIEYTGGVVDRALLVVDPAAAIETSGDGSTVTVPVRLNDAFDTVRYSSSRGRMLRLGVRIGG